ncbi:L-fucose/L-arabinose isomerase family protein [Vallitalea okinawensis]|uniref:L-fucose/L-arabinose isomerase family protein n=1 Tax=Vallitalea okinawensis TaxID=2078660 RepID=UPI000CFBF84D|nr:hypothetical protein [Vallitalea okinawensis]
MKVGLLSLGFPNFRYDYGEKYLKISIGRLKSDAYTLITCGRILIDEQSINQEIDRLRKENINLLIIQCGTYSYGSSMLKVIEMLEDIPLLLWGFPEPIIEGERGLPLNSLCGLNMYGSFLKKVNKKFSYVYGSVEDEVTYKKVQRTIQAVSIKNTLKQSKFCVIGGRVPGFYLSNVDEIRFRHEIGPEIVYYSIASLLEDAGKINDQIVNDEVKKMKTEVCCVTTTDAMLVKSARLYLAIKAFQEKNAIQGFAIKCWPEFQQLYQSSVCGVVSRLNNEGIMTSCEGDVTGLVTMYMQHLITKQPCFFADLVNINDEGIVKAWHCGPAPICLARDHSTTQYCEHPTIKQGIGFAVEFKMLLGRLTMIKLKEGHEGYKFFIATGTGVEEDRDLVANQADIRFDSTAEQLLDTIMEHGIEHHYAIVYHEIKDDLLEVCKWMNIEPIIV